MDWMRNLRFTLRYENKKYVLDEQIPTINDDSTQEEIESHQKLESLNMVFYAELSINIILSGIKKIDVPSTSAAPVLTVGHNAKKRKTSHSNWKGKAAQEKSNRGSKRKAESDISPTSYPKEAVCFYCNTTGHWKRSYPKYPKDLKDRKVEKGGHSCMFMIELHNTTTSDSWVLDIGCGTHICTVLQGLKESRSYPEESFGYLFYKPKDNVVFVARKGVFLKREMISKEDSRSKIDRKEIQKSDDEEPIVNTDTQQEFYYGFHIEEDKISDSTLSELDEPANYKEAMASPKAAK
ncbi:hypothetical protein Tco_1524973 [Tanacetum coccineum]